MDWSKIKIPSGNRILKIHNFMYMRDGNAYELEVDEFSDGKFTGHGEHSSDESQQLNSVVGDTLETCLQALIDDVEK
jgi:hypothetical protein